MLQVGDVVGSRFELLEQLGRGGMGTVWKAHDTILNRVAALKVIHEDLVPDATSQGRFRSEAQIAADLVHPNIVRVLQYEVTSDDQTFLIMDYIEGLTLHDLMLAERLGDEGWRIRVLTEIASALTYAHDRGVIHRDIKPANILIRADNGAAMLTDFGIALAAGTMRMTGHGQILATPLYASPEQLATKSLGPASDVYSLAVVAYELFAGSLPHNGTFEQVYSARRDAEAPPLPRAVSPAVSRAIMRGLRRNPAERQRSARQFAAELVGGLGPTAKRPGPNTGYGPDGTKEFRLGATMVGAVPTYPTGAVSGNEGVDDGWLSRLLFATTPRTFAITAGEGLERGERHWQTAFVLVPAILGIVLAVFVYLLAEVLIAALGGW